MVQGEDQEGAALFILTKISRKMSKFILETNNFTKF